MLPTSRTINPTTPADEESKMNAVEPTHSRRLSELEAKEPGANGLEPSDLAAKDAEPIGPPTHYFFRDPHQTEADIAAEIAAGRKSRAIRKGERCVIVRRRSVGDEPPPA
jgi:hypothetical protein